MDARRRLLGDAADRFGVLAVPAGMALQPRLDGGVQHFLFFVRGGVEEFRVAVLGALAKVDQHGGVAAVVEDHVRRAAVRPFEDPVGIVPIVLEALALDREHGRAGRGDRRGGVVLGRIDVAGGPADIGAERLQGLDENRGLNGHVQGAGDARALQRLLLREFGAGRHQARHFGLGDRDLLAAVVGKLDVGDGVIVGMAHERSGGLGHGRRKSFFRNGPSLISGVRNAQCTYKQIFISIFGSKIFPRTVVIWLIHKCYLIVSVARCKVSAVNNKQAFWRQGCCGQRARRVL